MSQSAPITIASVDLRAKTEESLGKIPDKLWQKAEEYGRLKLNIYRERWPDVDYYDNAYLEALTIDTVRELAFSEYTVTLSIALMSEGYTPTNTILLEGAKTL